MTSWPTEALLPGDGAFSDPRQDLRYMRKAPRG